MNKGGNPDSPALPESDRELFQSELSDVEPITHHGRFLHPPTRLPPIPLSRLRDEREVIHESMHDPIRWDERVAKNLVRLLADSVNTASPLNEADDGPGQVVVDDNVCVLKVLALRQHVGCD